MTISINIYGDRRSISVTLGFSGQILRLKVDKFRQNIVATLFRKKRELLYNGKEESEALCTYAVSSFHRVLLYHACIFILRDYPTIRAGIKMV